MDKDFFDKIREVQREGINIKISKRNPDFDIHDSATWKSKCCECNWIMDYINSEHDPRYIAKSAEIFWKFKEQNDTLPNKST